MKTSEAAAKALDTYRHFEKEKGSLCAYDILLGYFLGLSEESITESQFFFLVKGTGSLSSEELILRLQTISEMEE